MEVVVLGDTDPLGMQAGTGRSSTKAHMKGSKNPRTLWPHRTTTQQLCMKLLEDCAATLAEICDGPV